MPAGAPSLDPGYCYLTAIAVYSFNNIGCKLICHVYLKVLFSSFHSVSFKKNYKPKQYKKFEKYKDIYGINFLPDTSAPSTSHPWSFL